MAATLCATRAGSCMGPMCPKPSNLHMQLTINMQACCAWSYVFLAPVLCASSGTLRPSSIQETAVFLRPGNIELHLTHRIT